MTAPNLSFKEKIKRNFGTTGFSISLIFHLCLLILALFWVTSHFEISVGKDPASFNTGAGGGNEGQNAMLREHQLLRKKARQVVRETPNKLIAKGTTSKIALPDMPNMSMSSLQSGLLAGDLSKGFGGGSGGGVGGGHGPGIGGGRNLVGKFIMGTRVQAEKIAVYLDNSGSMTPYLPQVKEEIYSQFPDADIFEHVGIVTIVRNGTVYMGREKNSPQASQRFPSSSRNKQEQDTGGNKLSALGANILHRYGNNFHSGSVGAWLDIMQREKYDALVVFSDFQDGLRQYENNRLIYSETMQGGVTGNRTPSQRRWEDEWANQFGRRGAPKLYLFSIQVEPQSFLKRCVSASKGEIKMVTHLRR